jgi:predicted NACHT family NTPase
MQSGPKGLAGNFIHRIELQEEIQEYIQNRYKEKPANAKVIAESIIDQLRKRNFILCLHGADYYGFIHRTFLEYFCANSIVEKFNDHKIDIENLKNDFYGKYWEDKTWHEVLRLICGMKEIVVNDIIQYLMQIYNPQWYGERPPWNIVLAIKCLSEIRDPRAIDETAKNLLLRIFELFDMVRWTKDINQFNC